MQEQAVKQNITTLHNRVNELGVAEPVIQQQGLDRVVVQLPGVQDTAKAKDIIGRTATLEVRMVNETAEAREAERGSTPVPFGSERFLERDGRPIIVLRQVVLTGENLTDAQPGFDGADAGAGGQPHARRQGRAHLQGRDARERRQAHGHRAVREGQGRGRHRAGDPQRDRRRPRADLAAA